MLTPVVAKHNCYGHAGGLDWPSAQPAAMIFFACCGHTGQGLITVERPSCSLCSLPGGQGCNLAWPSTSSPGTTVVHQRPGLSPYAACWEAWLQAMQAYWCVGLSPLLLRAGVTLEWHHPARAACQVGWGRSYAFQGGLLCGKGLQGNMRLGHGGASKLNRDCSNWLLKGSRYLGWIADIWRARRVVPTRTNLLQIPALQHTS